MTNAEKYLKDGIDIDDFVEKLGNYIKEDTGCALFCVLQNFLIQPARPQLSKDARVILSKIKSDYKYIGKKEFLGTEFLYVSCKKNGEELSTLIPFNHLFQFIKERRRIRDKGVIKR